MATPKFTVSNFPTPRTGGGSKFCGVASNGGGSAVSRIASAAGGWFLRMATRFRIRHFRGHGVHSPFAYSFVREVFMKRGLYGNDSTLYDALRAAGIKKICAVRLQNYFSQSKMERFLIDPALCYDEGTLTLFTAQCTGAVLPRCGEDSAAVFLDCRRSPARYRECRQIVEAHRGMSLDCRDFMMIFTLDTLNEQHIKL